jgi:multidrug resistance efflux pump
LSACSITLSEAERRLQETEIYAAFDGVLADVTVIEGGSGRRQ